MDRPHRYPREVGLGRFRTQVAIEGVPRLERDFLALLHLDRRRDVGMPAIVSSLGLLAERLAAIDGDGFHAVLLSDGSDDSSVRRDSTRSQRSQRRRGSPLDLGPGRPQSPCTPSTVRSREASMLLDRERPRGFSKVLTALFAVLLMAAGSATELRAQTSPDGQLTVAFDASIASSFLDPAETPGIATPFPFLYALHDALIKPMPGNDMAPCLAESWRESADGLSYEFKLREGVRFHNGDPFTAEDVKFSFHRYRGVSAKLLHERVKDVQIVDPHRVRFVLGAPWPDFLAFYATPATGAAWIVPKKYIAKVGEDGFSRQPVGLGPYRFVRANPGVELSLEANEQYWRKKPSIKRV